MKKLIEIKELTYIKNEKYILNNINFFLKTKDFITLIGPNGSGKEVLSKIIAGTKQYQGEIIIQDNLKIGYIFDNPENSFIMDTVYNDLLFTCQNNKITDINNKIIEISTKLNITEILSKSPYELSGGQKQKVALANALIINPDVLIIDNGLTMIDNISKNKIFELLKKSNITVLNITDNIEETLYGNRIIIMDKGQIIVNNTTKKALEQEKVFLDLNMHLPFIIELSNKLKLYDLIDKNYYSNESLINDLWLH